MQITEPQKQVTELLKQNKKQQALQFCAELAEKNDSNIEAYALAAMVHRSMNNRLQAVDCMRRVIELEPDNQTMLVTYSSDLLKLGRIDEGEAVLKRISPSYRSNPEYMLQEGLLYFHRHEFEQATKILVNLLKQHGHFATARLELAHVLLMHGKWDAGWEAFEARNQLPSIMSRIPRLRIPAWDGKKLDKRLLLIADEDIRDCLLFCRYIPMVSKRCNTVILFRSEQLSKLLDTVPGIDFSYSRWDEVSRAAKYCTLSGLPRLLSTRPDTVPDCEGLISIYHGLERIWREKITAASLQAKLRIGMAWSGRIDYPGNFLRAIPAVKMTPLLELPGCQFFSLQVGKLAHQAKELGIINMTASLTDFAETAAMIRALDLVITADTSIAHLAATLGKPTWVCLAYTPDWRWGASGNRTVWFNSAYLFRQTDSRSWDSVITEVKTQLQAIVSHPDPVHALKAFMSNEDQHL